MTNKFSKYYPSSENDFEPYQKQRGYVVSSEFGGPLDTTEILLTLPGNDMFNLYPGKIAYILDRDEYWFFNNENIWQRITESGIDNDTQAFFDIEFNISVKGSADNTFHNILKDGTDSRYDINSRNFIFKNGDEINISPYIVINFKGYAIDVSLSGDFNLPENGLPVNTLNSIHSITKKDSSFNFTISNDSSFIHSGNIIYNAVFDNGTETVEDDITIEGKVKYIIDPSTGNGFKTIFSDIKNNIIFMHPETTQLQKGFIVSSQNGGSLDVGSYTYDISILSTNNINFYIGKRFYSYLQDNWYYFSYNGGVNNFEINFPDFTKPVKNNERIKSFLANNNFNQAFPGKYIPFITNKNFVGNLSKFKINITADDPLLAKNINDNGWVISYDGWWQRNTGGSTPVHGQAYNYMNASGIIQPTGPDKTLINTPSRMVSDGGYEGLNTNLLDNPKKLTVNLQAVLQIGTNIYNIPVNIPDNNWSWNVNGTLLTEHTSSVSIDVSNYTYMNTTGDVSVNLNTVLPYFPDASIQNITYYINSYYRKAELHISKNLTGLLSDWIDSNDILIQKGRYDDDITELYVNLVATNKSFGRNDVDDEYYLLKADHQNETNFTAVKDDSTQLNNTVIEVPSLYGQYHIVDLSSGSNTNDYAITISDEFSNITGSLENPNAKDIRTYSIKLSDYIPNYSIKTYQDSNLTQLISYINFDILTYASTSYIYVSLLDNNDFLKGSTETRDGSIAWTVDKEITLNPNSEKDVSAEGYISDASINNFIICSIDEGITLSKGVSKAIKLGFDIENQSNIYNILKSGTADSIIYTINVTATDRILGANDSSTAEFSFQVHLESSKYQIQYRIEDISSGYNSIWFSTTDFSNSLKNVSQYPSGDTELPVLLNASGLYSHDNFTVRSRIVIADPSLDTNSRITINDSSINNFSLKVYDDVNNQIASEDSSSLPSVTVHRSYFNKSDRKRKLRLSVIAGVAGETIYSLKGNSYIEFNEYTPAIYARYTGFTSFLPSTSFIDKKSGFVKSLLTDNNDNTLIDKEFTDGYIVNYIWEITHNDDNLLSITSTDGSICNVDVSPNLTTEEKNIEITCTANSKRYSNSSLFYTSIFKIDYTISKNESISGISSTLSDIYANGHSIVKVPVTISGINLSGKNVFSSTGDFNIIPSETIVGAGKTTATYYFSYTPQASHFETITVNGAYTGNTVISKNFNIYVIGFDTSYILDSSYYFNKTPKLILDNTKNSILLNLYAVTDETGFGANTNVTSKITGINKPYSMPSVLTFGSSYYTGTTGSSYNWEITGPNKIKIYGFNSNSYDSSFVFIAGIDSTGIPSGSNMISFTTNTVNFVNPALSIQSPTTASLYTDINYNLTAKVTETNSAGLFDITSNINDALFKWNVPVYGGITGNNKVLNYTSEYKTPSDISLNVTVYPKDASIANSDNYILYNKIPNVTITNIINQISINDDILTDTTNDNNDMSLLVNTSRNDIEYISDFMEITATVSLNVNVNAVNNIDKMMNIGVTGSSYKFNPNIQNWTGNNDSSYRYLYTETSSQDSKTYIYHILVKPNYSRFISADDSMGYDMSFFNDKFKTTVNLGIRLKEITKTEQQMLIPYATDTVFYDKVIVTGRNLSVDELTQDVSFIYGKGNSLPLQAIDGITNVTIDSITTSTISASSFIITFKFQKIGENSQNFTNILNMHEINRYTGNVGITINIMDMRKIIQSANTSYSNFQIRMRTSNLTSWNPYQLAYYISKRN